MIDVQALRATTNEAIRAAEAARVARLAAEERAQREKSEWVRRETDLKVERILGQVPGRCAIEANAGRSHAIVMSLETRYGRNSQVGIYDYERPTNSGYNGEFNTAWLCGPGKIVYDNLVAAGLRVTVEYWHDGVGVESGYNLVVHW